ncbi:unnamed protein product [Durusdinium trenchii]|uniref:imidazoleglycerol-phosphate dehydratase n=1 Tax=Durusdinium trenchii TaxID=1381693 RepID=A0ABP0RUU8_9DINO
MAGMVPFGSPCSEKEHIEKSPPVVTPLALALGEAWRAGQLLRPHSNDAFVQGCDSEVAELVGSALGAALRQMLDERRPSGSFRFLVPLDEALTDLSLDFSEASVEIALAPFGAFPPAGRQRIGSFRTALTEVILRRVAEELKVGLKVKKLRGDNAHHIVEATFKSFARCLRRAMDAASGLVNGGPRFSAAVLGERRVQKKRGTKETNIDISVDLDLSPETPERVATGFHTLDALLRRLGSGLQLTASCVGDAWIDEHHSVEDVMITVGQALHQALGSKAGCCRMAFAEAAYQSAQVLCVMDLSNRPMLCSDLQWQGQQEEMAEDVSVEMLHHAFESFVVNAAMTVHLVQVRPEGAVSPCALDLALAAAEAALPAENGFRKDREIDGDAEYCKSERPVLALQASALEMQASVGWPGASMKVRQARVEKLTRKFELEKHKQEIVAFEMDHIEQAHVEEQRQIHRFSLRERLRQNRAAKDEWEARGHELWQENMKVRMTRENEQMRFSDKVLRTQQEKELTLRRQAAEEVLKGTQDFESGLVTLGLTKTKEDVIPEDSSEEETDSVEKLLAQTSKVASAKELVEALQAKLPTGQELNYEANLFMRKIKESKEAGAIARRERERRRRRVLVEQQREQEMLEENQLEQVLLEKLGRESIEESAISYRSWRVNMFEEVFVRNRQARQQQYIAQKRADKEEAG